MIGQRQMHFGPERCLRIAQVVNRFVEPAPHQPRPDAIRQRLGKPRVVSGGDPGRELLATLKRILSEHAGAQRAALLLPAPEGLSVAAEITSDPDGVRVDIPKGKRAPSPAALPLSVAHYVRRSREKLLSYLEQADRGEFDAVDLAVGTIEASRLEFDHKTCRHCA